MTQVAGSLIGAKLVEVDLERCLVLAWFGGHGVHAYNREGTEVSFWNVGDFSRDEAYESEVRDSMRKHIAGEVEYP